MPTERAAKGAAIVYFSAWTKKNLLSYNKVMIQRLVVLSPKGSIVYYDDEEKTIAIFPGRMSQKKMREAVKAHVELQLNDLEPDLSFPLENVVTRDKGEIEGLFARARKSTS